MADKTSATITLVDSENKKISKSITDISPTAGNHRIKDFCVALNALSTNTISSIEKIEKTDITAAQGEDPTFTVGGESAVSEPATDFSNGSLRVYVFNYLGSKRAITFSGKKIKQATVELNSEGSSLIVTGIGTIAAGDATATVTCTLAGDDTYRGATTTFTFTNAKSSDIVDI